MTALAWIAAYLVVAPVVACLVGRHLRHRSRLYLRALDESMARHPAGRAQPQREDVA